MASIVNIPFNHEPSETKRELTTYTVPVGKYARVLCNWYIEAGVDVFYAAASNYDLQVDTTSKSETTEIWVKEGDVITFTVTPASANALNSPTASFKDYTQMLITLNGNTFADFRTYAHYNDSVRTANISYTFNGSGDMNMFIEEYDVIS